MLYIFNLRPQDVGPEQPRKLISHRIPHLSVRNRSPKGFPMESAVRVRGRVSRRSSRTPGKGPFTRGRPNRFLVFWHSRGAIPRAPLRATRPERSRLASSGVFLNRESQVGAQGRLHFGDQNIVQVRDGAFWPKLSKYP